MWKTKKKHLGNNSMIFSCNSFFILPTFLFYVYLIVYLLFYVYLLVLLTFLLTFWNVLTCLLTFERTFKWRNCSCFFPEASKILKLEKKSLIIMTNKPPGRFSLPLDPEGEPRDSGFPYIFFCFFCIFPDLPWFFSGLWCIFLVLF